MMAPKPYFCIHCGHEEPQVYKTYAEGNLVKLLKCGGCGKLIDDYVEVEPMVLAINLLLLNKKAYRHLLLNHPFESFWKLAIIFLFLESYCTWCFSKGIEEEVVGYQELELNFYRVLLRTLISTAIFHLTMLTSCTLPWPLGPFPRKGGRPLKFSYLALWKGLCLSGYAELFDLITLIWAYSHTDVRLIFVTGLFALSNMQSYSVLTGAPVHYTWLILVTSLALQKTSLTYYDTYSYILLGN